MPATKTRRAIESIIDELAGEIAALNRQIDEVNNEIRANERTPPAREEIEAALRADIARRVNKYRERLKLDLRRPAKLNIMRVQDLDVAGGVPVKPDLEFLADGFAFLFEKIGDPAIADLLELAPSGGVTKQQKEEADAKLRAKKREKEAELESCYVELEKAGLKADRRPDLSPSVFLEFKSKEKWNQAKLEGQRERLVEQRSITSRLSAKRGDILNLRMKLDYQGANNSDTAEQAAQRKSEIAALTEEEKSLSKRIAETNQVHSRASTLLNKCLEFLREQDIKVDSHL